MKTHWKKIQNPEYLGAYSLDNGAGGYDEIVATIGSVKVEPVVGSDGKREECMVLRFRETGMKPMILNVTNAKTLEKLFHTPYIDDWAGHRIKIGVERVKAFGDVVDALRIRKTLPKEAEPVKCQDCGGEVTAAFGLSVAQIIANGRKRFGAVLCGECMKKRADASAQEETKEEANDDTE